MIINDDVCIRLLSVLTHMNFFNLLFFRAPTTDETPDGDDDRNHIRSIVYFVAMACPGGVPVPPHALITVYLL